MKTKKRVSSPKHWMKRTRITLSLPSFSSDEFTISYNGTDIKASKSKLGLYSAFFRKMQHFCSSSNYKITDKAPRDIFSEFIAAAQGKEFKLSPQNLFIFIRFSTIFEVESVLNICTTYFHNKPLIKEILKEVQIAKKEEKGEKYREILNDLIAAHLDECLQNNEFKNIPYKILKEILSSKAKVLNDRKLLINYLIELIPLMECDAFDLFSFIDLQDLDDAQVKRVFNNIQLMKYFASNKKLAVSGNILDDYSEIRSYAKRCDKRIRRLEKLKFQDRFEAISDNFCDIEERIEAEAKKRALEERNGNTEDSRIEKRLKQMADRLAMTTVDVTAKVNRQNKVQEAHVKEVECGIQGLKSQFEPIRAEMREMQRMLRVANVRQIAINEHINAHNKQKEAAKSEGNK